ncbi:MULTISPECIES: hypothetical protein [unclassified Chamaesiphon]|uniref:hypothetical protein n=1 Tax=unclassified Chamaesiphon TaxID=2620921 RepID=UPI00286CEB02|nr:MULTISPECIES: hypothetical protein [unclassified Chamaesiphon]
MTQREQFHSNRLGDNVSIYNLATQQRIDELTQLSIGRGSDALTAQARADNSIASTIILFFKKLKGAGAAGGH